MATKVLEDRGEALWTQRAEESASNGDPGGGLEVLGAGHPIPAGTIVSHDDCGGARARLEDFPGSTITVSRALGATS